MFQLPFSISKQINLLIYNALLKFKTHYWGLDKLTENQQQVIARRFGLRGHEKATLEDVGKEIDLTRERVRQIQVEALKTLRGLLERVGLTQEDLF